MQQRRKRIKITRALKDWEFTITIIGPLVKAQSQLSYLLQNLPVSYCRISSQIELQFFFPFKQRVGIGLDFARSIPSLLSTIAANSTSETEEKIISATAFQV